MHIAAKVNTEVANVRTWINKNGWKAEREAYLQDATSVNLDEIEAKPYAENFKVKHEQARVLFTEKGYNFSEIEKLIKVSRATLLKWAKEEAWHQDKEQNRLKAAGVDVLSLPTKIMQEPLNLQKAKAKILYTETGYEPSEIVDMLNLNSQTLMAWVHQEDWDDERVNNILLQLRGIGLIEKKKLSDSILAKQLKAKYLIQVKGYNQKEVAEKLTVSEKTMSKWAKENGWQDELKKKYKLKGGFAELMEGFVKMVKLKAPGMAKDVLKLWGKYLQELEEHAFDT